VRSRSRCKKRSQDDPQADGHRDAQAQDRLRQGRPRQGHLGPFFDFTGIVDDIQPEKEKVRALISIFGRETPVELEFYQNRKVFGDPPNPFTASWRATNGRFWQTLGFMIVLGILSAIILEVPGGILLWIATFAPFIGIVVFPAVFALYVWVVCFAYLAEARWYLHLRSR
jgi:hypothetical protein